MIAMTTSISMRVNPASRGHEPRRRERICTFSAGPGSRCRPRQPQRRTCARCDGVPAGCSWPKHQTEHSTGRSSGLRLVAAPDRLPASGSPVAWECPGAWPITAAAPRRICTGFPIHRQPRNEAAEPVVTGKMIRRSTSRFKREDRRFVLRFISSQGGGSEGREMK